MSCCHSDHNDESIDLSMVDFLFHVEERPESVLSSSVNSVSSTWPAELPIACFYLIEEVVRLLYHASCPSSNGYHPKTQNPAMHPMFHPCHTAPMPSSRNLQCIPCRLYHAVCIHPIHPIFHPTPCHVMPCHALPFICLMLCNTTACVPRLRPHDKKAFQYEFVPCRHAAALGPFADSTLSKDCSFENMAYTLFCPFWASVIFENRASGNLFPTLRLSRTLCGMY